MSYEIKVSVVVPVYNTASRLDALMGALLAQTLREIEIILVNDGSTDNSADILRNYAEANPQKIFLIEKKNGGAASARNAGILRARGKWIYFCDSDDLPDTDICEYLLNLAERGGADIASCGLYRQRPDGELSPDFNCRCSGEEYLDFAAFSKRWLRPLFLERADRGARIFTYTSLCLFKTEIVRARNLRFNEKMKISEDEAFMMEYLCLCKTVALSDKIKYRYVFYGDSLCDTFFRKRRDSAFVVRRTYYERDANRRRLWSEFFGSDSEYGSVLSYLASAEICHFAMLKISSSGGFFAKISEIRKYVKKVFSDSGVLRYRAEWRKLRRSKRALLKLAAVDGIFVWAVCFAADLFRRN